METITNKRYENDQPLANTITKKQVSIWCFILVISLFFMWGFANSLNDILIQQFKKTFTLSDFQSGLVQSAFYLGYFLCAIPAGAVMQRYGYKKAIIVGLALYALGALLFYPAAEVRVYSFFLVALFIIASGLAFLETSANPYIVAMGDARTAQQRLNFAQSFNPLGTISGVLVGQQYIFSGVEYSDEQFLQLTLLEQDRFFASEALAVQTPYLVLGLIILLWGLMFIITKFPELSPRKSVTDGAADVEHGSYRQLFRFPHFRAAVFAQFCYVGAQVGVWSFLIRYCLHADADLTEKLAANALTASLVLFMIGRFLGTWLMSKIAGHTLMAVFALINVVLTLLAVVFGGYVGIYALICLSFGMSIMFPTIFAIGISNVGQQTKLAASVLVMAIIGGAVFAALMGAASDRFGIQFAYLVPMLCFIIIARFARSSARGILDE